MSRLIAFGSSTIQDKTAYPALVARRLNFDYVNRAKVLNSNHKIARMVLSYPDYQPNDFVLVEWTSTIRHEFRTELGWMPSNMNSYKKGTGSFEEAYYTNGPGRWEYNGIYTMLKEIVLAQTFLKAQNIKHLFLFYPDDLLASFLYKEPDQYLGSMIQLIDWSRFLHFDGHGFREWCLINNYAFEEGSSHPAPMSHRLAADYILNNFKIPE
jgi:hypothetical protein